MELNRVNGKIIKKHNNWSHGDGLAFDGLVTQVQLPDIPTPNAWTVVFNIKKNNTIPTSDPYYGLQALISGNSQTNFLGIKENGISIYDTTIVDEPLLNDSDYFLAFIYNGNLLQGVVNNTIGNGVVIPNILSDNNKVLGTRLYFGGYHRFQQSMHDLKIFNKALDISEVKYMYDRKGRSIPSTATANLLAWYDFSQRQGMILLDRSGNNRHGNLQGYTPANTSFGAANQWRNQYNLPHLNP